MLIYFHDKIKYHTFSSFPVFGIQCRFFFAIILTIKTFITVPLIGSKHVQICPSQYSCTFLYVYQNPISSEFLFKSKHTPVRFVLHDGRSVSKSPAESRSAQVTFKCRPPVLWWLWCPPLALSAICMVICTQLLGAECYHHYPGNPHSCSPVIGIDNHHNDNN